MAIELRSEDAFTEEDLREMVLRLAHEIRNPLATIKSAVQLIEHLQRPIPEVEEFFAGIHTEIERIDRVVRDMQRYVRLDVHTAVSVTVAEAVARAVEREAETCRSSGSSVDIVPGPEAVVLVDRGQIEAALGELINNALRFSPPGSTVTLRWEPRGRDSVVIAIEDQGPGIPPDLESRILRPFFSTSTQGTGLGLNIASRAAQLAGGDLRWSNRVEGGARFALRLPRL